MRDEVEEKKLKKDNQQNKQKSKERGQKRI